MAATNYDFDKKWNSDCVPNLIKLRQTIDSNQHLIRLSNSILFHGVMPLIYSVPQSLLPPCSAIVRDLESLYTDFKLHQEKLVEQWKKPIDIKTIYAHFDEFITLFPSVVDELNINVVHLLRLTGYEDHLHTKNLTHSVKALSDYYVSTSENIYWYVIPSSCRPWNTEFGFELATIVEPLVKWKQQVIYLDGQEEHATVMSDDETQMFDILLWYSGLVSHTNSPVDLETFNARLKEKNDSFKVSLSSALSNS